MYRKDLYSNSSDSSHNGSGSWIYIDGEFYHAGVKGMKWGKHLPGTDWWKYTVQKYNYDHLVPVRKNPRTLTGYDYKWPSQFRAHGHAAKEAAKLYGGYIKNNVKVLKNFATDVTKKSVRNFLDKQYSKVSDTRNNPSKITTGKSGDNYLIKYLEPQAQKALSAYSKATINGPIGNMFNSFLQSTKYNVMAASAKLLDYIGMDDEVDNLLSKMNIKIKK